MPVRVDAFARSVGSLLVERRALVAKEKALVRKFNRLLNRLGYQVVASDTAGPLRRQRRRRRRAGRRRSRRPAVARVRRRRRSRR